MMKPHFVTLAQLDDHHFINACRHGVVHLTWERITARFRQDEFQRLADLLQQAADDEPPASVRDGDLRVTVRPDDDCELQVGSLILLLPTTGFHDLARIAREAAQKLQKLLASGAWDQDGPEEPPDSTLDQLRRIPFSRN
jgi:hypothetical protein